MLYLTVAVYLSNSNSVTVFFRATMVSNDIGDGVLLLSRVSYGLPATSIVKSVVKVDNNELHRDKLRGSYM